jgi:hypothetical protein
VKEMFTFVIEDETMSRVVDDVAFCRKRIEVRREGSWLCVRSEPAVPLNEVLTNNNVSKDSDTQIKIWKTVDNELRNFDRMYSGYQWITDALRTLAVERLPLISLTRSVTFNYETDMALRMVGTRYCSDRSVSLADIVPPLFHLNNAYYTNCDQAINFLLCRGKLVMQLIRYEGVLRRVVMTESEGKRYRKLFRLRYENPVVVVCTRAVVERLRN